MYKSVLLFGPPCAGKGTAGKKLAQAVRGFCYVASGDIVRDILAENESLPYKKKSELARKIIDCISAGKLIPDVDICHVFWDRMESFVKKNLYRPDKELLLIDGIPRTLRQAEYLAFTIDVVDIYHFTNVPDRVLMKRMNNRVLEARAAGRTPRDDDNPDAMKARLEDYRRLMLPTLQFYSGQVPIFEVNASRSKAQVLEQLVDRAVDTLKVL